jgi:hypothetical protein
MVNSFECVWFARRPIERIRGRRTPAAVERTVFYERCDARCRADPAGLEPNLSPLSEPCVRTRIVEYDRDAAPRGDPKHCVIHGQSAAIKDVRVTDLWQIDPDLGESLQPREREIAQKISALIARGVQEQFSKQGAPARRDVHSRAHGCLRAEFKVEESLPPHLAQGVFVPGATYSAWIRYSNGNPSLQRPDAKGDARAMAIKLLDVPGEKILPSERSAMTQDFILLNSPVFMAYDAAGYLSFLQRQNSSNPIARFCAPLALGIKGGLIGLKMLSSRIGNPLATRYWSTVPFQLGDGHHKQAIKFSAVPHAPAEPVPIRATQGFLRETMMAYLSVRDATFDFVVQPRTSPSMSVEDSRVEWLEAEAPSYKVATITIPKQEFANSARDALAETLAFNPWHALPQHRPIGSINRARRVVYETTSELRRRLNGVSPHEPMTNV